MRTAEGRLVIVQGDESVMCACACVCMNKLKVRAGWRKGLKV